MFIFDRAKKEKKQYGIVYHLYTLLDTQYITERSSFKSGSSYIKNDVYSQDPSMITIIFYQSIDWMRNIISAVMTVCC